MRLVSFTVEKYRSITRAHKISTEQSTILIGPNNEGKSNILRALVAAMNVLTRGREFTSEKNRQIMRFGLRNFYNWEFDFPVHLQGDHQEGESVVELEFGLTESETAGFREAIGSNLNGTLPLRVSLGQKAASVQVAKQGPGARALTAKSNQIARFVAARLDFEHIPAVRTAQSAQEIVEEMIARELESLEQNQEYQETLQKIATLQQPLLDGLATSIRRTLKDFLPQVSDVKLQISSEKRYRALRRSCEIVVDDGTPTLLEYKGDGVQSLAALGIMRYASDRRGTLRNLVIAIEEPESHLHPRAIHELKAVLDELSARHQVVVTTHCPLFVDRARIRQNIVVTKGKARPAKNVQEVRDILGVKASDNLRHAEIVLLVEGEEDKIALEGLFRHCSPLLRAGLDNGTLAVDTLAGATNLPYKLTLLRQALCRYHCFLDDDRSGRESFDRARTEGLIGDADCNFSTCDGMSDAEIEDLYDPSVYAAAIEQHYRLQTLHVAKFRSRKKWTERMRDVFRQYGKAWDNRAEMAVKRRVAEMVAQNPGNALNGHKRAAFDALVTVLESRLLEPNRAEQQSAQE